MGDLLPTPGASQESVEPLADEMARLSVDEAQDLLQPAVDETNVQMFDKKLFDSVPEHGGNLKALLEKHGGDPGGCPFLKSMGAAGIDLVQKLALAESNPNRGPTIKELMEAKKRSRETASVTTEKPDYVITAKDVVQDTNMTDLNKILVAPENKDPYRAEEAFLARQRVFEEQEKVRALIDPEAPRTESQEATTLTVQKIRVKEPAALVNEAKLFEAKEASVVSVESLGVQPDKNKTVFSDIEPAVIDRAEVIPYIDSLDTTTETSNPALGTAEIIHELARTHDQDSDTTEVELGGNPVVNILLADTDTATGSEPKELMDVADKYTIELQVTPKIEAVVASVDITEEINAYIQLLSPEHAEEAKTALNDVMLAIHSNQETLIADSGESVVTTEQLQTLCAKLLESLGVDYTNETVVALIKSVTDSLLLDPTGNNQPTIDELNYMGTNEYKSNSTVSLLTNLAQLIKKEMQPYLQLGKYALHFSTS